MRLTFFVNLVLVVCLVGLIGGLLIYRVTTPTTTTTCTVTTNAELVCPEAQSGIDITRVDLDELKFNLVIAVPLLLALILFNVTIFVNRFVRIGAPYWLKTTFGVMFILPALLYSLVIYWSFTHLTF